MDPVTIAVLAGAGSSVIASIAAYYQNKQAMKANEEELKRIRAMWESIVPPDSQVSIDDPPELIKSLPPPPDLDLSNITPELFQAVEQYQPETAAYVKEQAPQLVEYSAQGRTGQDAMLDALNQYKQIASQDQDPELMLKLRQAQNDAGAASQSRANSIQQDYARRGQLGSTQQLAAQISAGEAQTNRMADLEMQALAEAYKNKLGALDKSANIGNSLSSADLSKQSMNANIVNKFNQRFAAGQNQFNLANANIINDAKKTNFANNQNISNMNTQATNNAMTQNRNMQNQGAKDLYNIGVDRVDFTNNANQKDWQNNLSKNELERNQKQQQFQNLVTLMQGKTNAGKDIGQNRLDTAQANSNIISALGNVGMQGAKVYSDYKKNNPAQETTIPETTIPDRDEIMAGDEWEKYMRGK